MPFKGEVQENGSNPSGRRSSENAEIVRHDCIFVGFLGEYGEGGK